MKSRMNILFISLMIFTPIFLGVLFLFSPTFSYFDESTKMISYTLSVSLLELILFGVFLYSQKQFFKHPKFLKTNEDVEPFKKYWWAFLSILILVPSSIFFLVSFSKDVFDLLNYFIFVFVGLLFIVKRPISSNNIFSRKLEKILGYSMFVCGTLLVLMEIFTQI